MIQKEYGGILKIMFFAFLLGCTFLFSSCSRKEKTLAGIGIGAVTGGVIGGAAGGGTGAAVGVVGGGVIGGLIGHSTGKDKK